MSLFSKSGKAFRLSKADPALAIAACDKGDFQVALRIFLPLARSGHAESQYRLGIMYANGHGIVQDYGDAVEWLGKAAEQGHLEAQYQLGLIYVSGRGAPHDGAHVVKWFRRAAERNHSAAQANLDLLHPNGLGVPQNLEAGIALYRKAAEAGMPNA